MPRRRTVLLAAACALAFAGVANASVSTDAKRARKGIDEAARAHWLKSADAARYRADTTNAVAEWRRLPPARATALAAVLSEVAAQSGSYIAPRALALFSMLEENEHYLGSHAAPTTRIDVTDADGIVYRWFWRRGFQFHPLANFGALNAAATAEDPDATARLAAALVARAIPRGPALRWEYYFRFGGAVPWTSGMAQAVAAQALSRAAALVSDPSLLTAAGRAYSAVPGALVQRLSAGPWIRLYSFNREIVFNAQLQTIVSLRDYAQATGDSAAQALADAMDVAAQVMLPRFDTGYWSLYELGGHEASLEYEEFVTQLLIKLAQQTQNPVWQDAATRFYAYLRVPPQVVPAMLPAPIAVYPKPRDNFLDTAAVSFSLSKRSSVTLTAGGVSVTATLDRGDRTLTWSPGTLAPGTYPAQLTAVDLAGNRTSVTLPQPIVVGWDTTPPQQLQGTLQDGVVSWSAVDPGTPWLRLRVVLRDVTTGAPTIVELGRQQLQGSLPVTLPAGSWHVTLGAQNSAGLWSAVALGDIDVPG